MKSSYKKCPKRWGQMYWILGTNVLNVQDECPQYCGHFFRQGFWRFPLMEDFYLWSFTSLFMAIYVSLQRMYFFWFVAMQQLRRPDVASVTSGCSKINLLLNECSYFDYTKQEGGNESRKEEKIRSLLIIS